MARLGNGKMDCLLLTHDFVQPTTYNALSLNQWIFISFFVDKAAYRQIGFRYYLLPSSNSVQITYKQQTMPSSPYQLKPSATIFWGGRDNYEMNCYCYVQFVRLYWDYLADTQEKMINLALMSPDSILIILPFFI